MPRSILATAIVGCVGTPASNTQKDLALHPCTPSAAIGSPMAAIIMSLLLMASGCGGKGSTKFTYETPILPLGVSFKADSDGLYAVAAGIVTPLGTFAIEHEFETRSDFTYIVLRNREKGLDQVFRLGATGHVDIHAVGEHRIRMYREETKWIIETQTISGTLDLEVRPSNAVIARVDFGEGNPDFIVTTDHKLVVEYPSMFTASRTVHVDTIESISLLEPYTGSKTMLWTTWKKGVEAESLWFVLPNSDETRANFDALGKAINTVSPSVIVSSKSVLYAIYVSLLFMLVNLLIASKIEKLSGVQSLGWLCLWFWWALAVLFFTLTLKGVLLNCAGWLLSAFIGLGIGSRRSGK